MGDLLEAEEEIAETSLRREKEKWQLEEQFLSIKGYWRVQLFIL